MKTAFFNGKNFFAKIKKNVTFAGFNVTINV